MASIHRINQTTNPPVTGHRVTLWCELLKAILEDRPVTLLERAARPVPTPPAYLDNTDNAVDNAVDNDNDNANHLDEMQGNNVPSTQKRMAQQLRLI